MFLAVTPIEEFWDKSDELLFIGPWCALHDRRDAWRRLRHRFLADPWRDPRRFRDAAAYCREVSDRLLPKLRNRLNELHGVGRGLREWKILLDPWLTYHVEQLYDHWVYVGDALAAEPGLRTIRLDPASYETPSDTADFTRRKVAHRFQLQLFSHILAEKIPESPTRSLPPDTLPPPPSGPKALLKASIARAMASLTPSSMGEVLIGELGLNRSERGALIVRSGFAALPYLADLPRTPPARMDERRQSLSALAADDEFERMLVRGLPHHLPAIYLEGYAAATGATRKSLPKPPRIVFTTNGCHYDDPFKFAAAESVARGAALWGYQHGGGYGMADYTPAETFERSISDRYYCWGWSSLTEDESVRDLPPPMLSRGGPSGTGPEILFVSMSLDLHNIRLCTNHDRALDYIARQGRFLNSLPKAIADRVLMRLHTDFGWRHRERIAELYPAVRFDDFHVTFSRRLRTSRLAYFDGASTPLLEAMAADVPCVMSWDDDLFPFRPRVKPFFQALKDVGILCATPQEAAAQIGRVYADPRAWWDEPERRKAHRAFAETFARSSPDWLDAWLKEIREGLSER